MHNSPRTHVAGGLATTLLLGALAFTPLTVAESSHANTPRGHCLDKGAPHLPHNATHERGSLRGVRPNKDYLLLCPLNGHVPGCKTKRERDHQLGDTQPGVSAGM